MNFMGMFNFKAPWLPWILLVVSLLMNEALPIVDLVGVIVGHIYFYFEVPVLLLVTFGLNLFHVGHLPQNITRQAHSPDSAHLVRATLARKET